MFVPGLQCCIAAYLGAGNFLAYPGVGKLVRIVPIITQIPGVLDGSQVLPCKYTQDNPR